MTKTDFNNKAMAISFSIFALLIILFPKESLEASKYGLSMWWNVVFPSLLPFFIASELLIGYGVVRFIGILLEPLMRPLFRVPGVGGFVWAMGMASGFPAGAKFTARLRETNQITRIEAERLISFTNCSNPLFIIAAVSVGFFHNEQLALVLLISHYLSNFCVGILMRFYGKEKQSDRRKPSFFVKEEVSSPPPLGKMLGDAVIHSVQTLLMIGGFIILFSVLNQMLSLIGFTKFLGMFIGVVLASFGVPETLGIPMISGLFEITLGTKLVSESDSILLYKTMMASFILAFSGLSVQAQVASIISETDIRFTPFFIGRVLQGIFAIIFTYIFFQPLYIKSTISEGVVSAFKPVHPENWLVFFNEILSIGPIITITSIIIYLLIYWRRYVLRSTL
ncbi:sporulation integral membrane protein YlbJ [Bacillus kexueae]|uniref:sporulation integral membrane protein YlbJ n=1 Tax=Aeribacillus kexueae TaxID=2078952 RepID=UPI00311A94FD